MIDYTCTLYKSAGVTDRLITEARHDMTYNFMHIKLFVQSCACFKVNNVYEFSCKKINLSTFSGGVKRFCLLAITFPDGLNKCSDGTLVATKAKYFSTSLHIGLSQGQEIFQLTRFQFFSHFAESGHDD